MQGVFFHEWNIFSSREKERIQDILFKERGIVSEEAKKEFFDEKAIFHPPSLLKDYKKALERIFIAIKNNERIIVFGDYDVDGVTGTTILYSALSQAGAQVSYRIPHRKRDGYGIKKHHIEEIHSKQVSLIITVDNGIAATEEVAYANTLGIDVIITDHHIPQKTIPSAYALINPKQEDCSYPFKELCGAALAYKLALGIAESFFQEQAYERFAEESLELTTIATVADCMPLIGENRVIVKEGLKLIRKSKQIGILSLAQQGGFSLEFSDTDTLGFQIAPRINAAGRLSEAYLGLQLLLGNTELAKELERLNHVRKSLVEKSLQETGIIQKNSIIIASSPEWHTGIIGLIAGKLTEQHFLPSIILEEQEHRLVASCRAPVGFDLFAFLSEFKEYFEHFGGHEQAAGFSILKEKFPAFKELAHRRSQEILKSFPLKKILHIVSELSADEIHLETFAQISTFEPFGIGNEKPVFLLRNIENIIWNSMGKGKHLSGTFKSSSGEYIRIIKFSAGEWAQKLPNQNVDIACSLMKNSWNGKESIELQLHDVRSCFP